MQFNSPPPPRWSRVGVRYIEFISRLGDRHPSPVRTILIVARYGAAVGIATVGRLGEGPVGRSAASVRDQVRRVAGD